MRQLGVRCKSSGFLYGNGITDGREPGCYRVRAHSWAWCSSHPISALDYTTVHALLFQAARNSLHATQRPRGCTPGPLRSRTRRIDHRPLHRPCKVPTCSRLQTPRCNYFRSMLHSPVRVLVELLSNDPFPGNRDIDLDAARYRRWRYPRT
jgi:hypothetical protein